MARRAGAKVISVPLNENDWSIPRQKLQEAFSPKTKLILINTPHNPTGKVLFLIHMCQKKSHFIMSYVSSSIPGKVLPRNKFGLKNVFSREVHKFGIALACMTFHTKFFLKSCTLFGQILACLICRLCEDETDHQFFAFWKVSTFQAPRLAS